MRWTALSLSLSLACAGASGLGGGHVDSDHPAVGLLSSDCSGVLVNSQYVLTAAHCVRDADAITFTDGSWRRVIPIDGCRAHPLAMPEPGDCASIDPDNTVREHDLAVLHLSTPLSASVARPTPVLLEAPSFPARQRLLLVGWHRHPARVGPARRYAGENIVEGIEGPMVHTLPLSPGGFHTEVGASGGPALMAQGSREWVVGILFGGTYPSSPDSLYVATFHPENAAWLARAMQPD